MPALEYRPDERAHDMAMMARSREIYLRLRSRNIALVVKAPVIEPEPVEMIDPPRHPLDADIYPFPLVYPEFVPIALRDLINPNAPRKPGTKDIIAEVAALAGLTYAHLVGPLRFVTVIRPRHFAIWRVHTEQKLSTKEVGRRFGGRDHTTVLNALKNINRVIASGELDPQNPAAWFINGGGNV